MRPLMRNSGPAPRVDRNYFRLSQVYNRGSGKSRDSGRSMSFGILSEESSRRAELVALASLPHQIATLNAAKQHHLMKKQAGVRFAFFCPHAHVIDQHGCRPAEIADHPGIHYSSVSRMGKGERYCQAAGPDHADSHPKPSLTEKRT